MEYRFVPLLGTTRLPRSLLRSAPVRFASIVAQVRGGHHNVHVFEQHWDWTSQTFTWAAEPSPSISDIFNRVQTEHHTCLTSHMLNPAFVRTIFWELWIWLVCIHIYLSQIPLLLMNFLILIVCVDTLYVEYVCSSPLLERVQIFQTLAQSRLLSLLRKLGDEIEAEGSWKEILDHLAKVCI